jgi:tripartite-type tricarboxylate transporter receptor subunit TctC
MGKGGAELVAMTAGGHVIFGSGTIVASLPTMNAGLVRALAIASETRWPDLPDIPTTAEAGYPTANVKIWSGFSGPPRLPAAVADVWSKGLQEVMKNPEYLAKLKGLGAVPFYQNPAEMKEFIRKETDEVATLWGLK